MTVCSVEGCHRPVRQRGWCRTHYERVLRRGDPGTTPIHTNGTVQPRYCTCTGDDTPAPYPWGECPACFRLVNTEDQ